MRDYPKLPIPFYKGVLLGQLTLSPADYSDGKPARKVFQLRSRNKLTGVDKVEKYDLGEIEIEIQWIDRLYEAEMEAQQLR